jgi:hypothetical protein
MIDPSLGEAVNVKLGAGELKFANNSQIHVECSADYPGITELEFSMKLHS